MRVLFVFLSPEYLRYFDGTVRELDRAGHDIFLAVMRENRKESAKRRRVDPAPLGLAPRSNVGVVPFTRNRLFRFTRSLRGVIDFLRYLHPDYREARALRQRLKERRLPRSLAVLDRVRTLPAGLLRWLIKALCAFDRCLPADHAQLEFLRDLELDLVVVTPLVAARSEQTEVVKCARRLGLRSAACIASWDNLTNKGLVRITPDRVFVWNEAQKREAIRYHYVPHGRLEITGAPVFDYCFDACPSVSYRDFCEAASLRSDRSFVIFLGSSSFIAPNEEEIRFVHQWIRALRASASQALRDAGILIRPHPYNYHLWEGADLSTLDNVSLWPDASPELASASNQRDFFDSIFHSTAVVGINTSAMIEAAIIGRPVFTIKAGTFAHGQRETLHFNYLLQDRGGVARSAGNLREHCDQLARVFDGKDEAPDYSGFIERFVRPVDRHRPAAGILAAGLLELGTAASKVVGRASRGTGWAAGGERDGAAE